MNTKPPLVVIAGPTASGKSALALALSRLTPATIINADASQVYHDLRVVTARPTPEEEAETPHRLFGHVDGALAWSVADWAAEARLAISEAHEAARLPILVGGTGMYLRTLLDGIAPVPAIDQKVREAVRTLPARDAHAALAAEDPAAAARLAPADTTRVARALEVVRSTGRTLGEWQATKAGGVASEIRLTAVVLLPLRPWLFGRCDTRFETIFDHAQNEVAALVHRDLDLRLPVMRAIGVREIAAFQDNAIDRETALAAGRLATRQYAKRQYTWFRNQSGPDWHTVSTQVDFSATSDLAIKLRSLALT